MNPKNKIVFLILISCFALTTSLPAQLVQTLRGTVIDQVLQTPLAGATVTLSGTFRTTTTDINGNYKFSSIPVGTYTIQVTYLGFKEAVAQNITVNSGKETVVTVAMETNVREEKEVVVRADRRKNKPLNEMSLVSARAFTVEETQKYAAAVNDPLRMATNFAGVVAAFDGNNDIVIRGNSPTGLLWRMEGIDIPNPNHFASSGSSGGGISILSAQTLANSDFITGAFAAEYGNALSGVFDLRLRKGNNERREYSLQAGVLGLNASAEGPMKIAGKTGSYLVNYRYSTLSLLDKIGVDIGEGITNFQDLSYNLYMPTKKWGTFTLFGFGGLSSTSNKNNSDSTKWETEGDRYFGKYIGNTGMSALTHSINLGGRSVLKSAIGYSANENGYNQHYTEDDYSATPSYNENYITKKLTISSTLNHKLDNSNVFRAGVYGNFIGFKFYKKAKENPNAPLLEVINMEERTQTIQAFAQWQTKPTDNLTVNGGVHYLRLILNNTYGIDSRASVKWDISRRNSIAFAYGHHSQVLPWGIYFAKTQDATGKTVMMNKDLDLTRAHHFVLSHNILLAKNLRLKTEIYYQHLYDVPVSTYDTSMFSTLNIQGEYFTDPLVNKGKGRNYGVEISLEKYLSNDFYYMLSNSIYQSKYTAADGKERNTRYNGNYVSNLVAGKDFVYKNGARTLGLNIKMVYAGGFRTTPINFERSKAEGYTIYYQDRAFSQQNPVYFRSDIRVSMKWNRKHRTTTLSLDIQNVSNRKNLYERYYDPLKGKVVDENQVGMIPVLNYKIEF